MIEMVKKDKDNHLNISHKDCLFYFSSKPYIKGLSKVIKVL